MLTAVLFTVVFASQISFLSIHVPRKFAARAAGECPDWQRALQASRFYALANIALAVAGTGLLSAFLFVDVLAAMTPALLAVATYFFLQMAPLAIVAGPVLARRPEVARVTELAGPMRLADFVPPKAAGLAVALTSVPRKPRSKAVCRLVRGRGSEAVIRAGRPDPATQFDTSAL